MPETTNPWVILSITGQPADFQIQWLDSAGESGLLPSSGAGIKGDWETLSDRVKKLSEAMPLRGTRRLRLPVFIDLPVRHARLPWHRWIEHLLRTHDFPMEALSTVRLSQKKGEPRTPFQLPLNILTAGNASDGLRGAISSRDWLKEIEGADAGLVSDNWFRGMVMRGLRGAETDLLICEARYLRPLSFALRLAKQRPRLIAALTDAGSDLATGAVDYSSSLPGGTSLLVVPVGGASAAPSETIVELIRDFSHDLPLHELARQLPGGDGPEQPLLFSRPEDLHSLQLSDAVSGVTEEAMALGYSASSLGIERLTSVSDTGGLADVLSPYSTTGVGARLAYDTLDTVKGYLHESDGLSPLVRTRRELRQQREVGKEVSDAIAPLLKSNTTFRQTLLAGQGRVVDIAFQHSNEDGTGGAFLSASDTLIAKANYRLRVQVGKQSPVSLVSGRTPTIDLVLPPLERGQHHVLHVAFYSFDFDLRTPVLQRLLLPEFGASAPIYFEMAPLTAGIAGGRIAVYYDLPPGADGGELRNHLIQSFVLTAPVVEATSASPSAASSAKLDIKLDFSLTKRFSRLETLRPRYLSIALNDGPALGHHRLMVKRGGKAEDVDFRDDTLKRSVDEVRTALEWATDLVVQVKEDKTVTRPRFPADAPIGEENDFDDAIWKLAKLGRQFYEDVFLKLKDKQLMDDLRKAAKLGDEVIQVVHHAIDSPYPWALIYDSHLPKDIAKAPRPLVCKGFRRVKKDEKGKDRPFSCQECLKACEHPDRTTAVCVYGFWGTRHQIEQILPDGSQRDATAELKPMRDGAVGVMVGLDEGYLPEIPTDLVKEHGDGLIKPFSDHGDLLDTLWSTTDRPAIVLLAGHYKTLDSDNEVKGPRVGLSGGRFLQPRDLASRYIDKKAWQGDPHSVVLLAICSGGAMPWENVVNFVNGFTKVGAGAVLGPEAFVYDGLAKRFAVEVTDAVIKGSTVGAAILRFRRSLLLDLNPLGLVFTAYGQADLACAKQPSAAAVVS
jgi:hypothetical protein